VRILAQNRENVRASLFSRGAAVTRPPAHASSDTVSYVCHSPRRQLTWVLLECRVLQRFASSWFLCFGGPGTFLSDVQQHVINGGHDITNDWNEAVCIVRHSRFWGSGDHLQHCAAADHWGALHKQLDRSTVPYSRSYGQGRLRSSRPWWTTTLTMHRTSLGRAPTLLHLMSSLRSSTVVIRILVPYRVLVEVLWELQSMLSRSSLTTQWIVCYSESSDTTHLT